MFRYLKRTSVSTRLWLLVGMFSAVVLADNLLEIHLHGKRLRAEKELQLEQLVDTAHSILQAYESQARAGRLSDAAARQQAIAAVRALRYGDREYFWIHDLAQPVPRMVMHPTVPELDGSVLDSPRFERATARRTSAQADAVPLAGDNLFIAMNAVAMSPEGRGFVAYDWPKPLGVGVTAELFPKLSFVKRFEPWDWVIGSGIYMDELEGAYWRGIQLNIMKASAWLLLFGVLAWAILRTIVRPLRTLQRSIEQLRDDPDEQVVLAADPPQELGQLANSFRSLMDELQQSRRALHASLDDLRLAGCAVAEMSEGVVVTDADGIIVSVNPAFSRISGYTPDEAIGRKPSLLKSGQHDTAFYVAMWQQITTRGAWSGEVWNRTRGGRLYLEWLSISASCDAAGRVRNYVGVFSDITERKKGDAAREEALERLQKIASRVPGVVFQFRLRADGSSCVPYASEAIREVYRVSPEEVRDDAAPVFAVVHPDDLPGHLASIQESARELTPWHQEYRLKFEGESDIWLLGNATPQREADGAVLWHGFITDITGHKHAEEALRVAAIAFESQEGMLITDATGTILRVNRAFTTITGYSVEDAVGETMSLLKSGRHDAAFYAAMWDSIQRTGAWQGEVWNRRKNGEVYAEWLTITAVKDEHGTITQFVGTLTDITLRKAAEDEIKHLAFYDPLTRLPNRRLLMDRLQQALAASARNGRAGALLFIDLDNFKTLNDTLGHDVGDLLLQQVAQRLSACVREGDTVARLGGDEFVVMLEDLSENTQEAAAQTETVGNKILAALGQPYVLGVHRCNSSTPSIGATQFTGHQTGIDGLLKQADLAMYQAKAAGRNTLRFFDQRMQAVVSTRAALEADLREGLRTGQFLLHYQPQVDGDRLTGAEVLLRWQHPLRGLVPPDEFIPLAEESGLILPIGQWVLETACGQLAAWASEPHLAHLTMAVNVSARQFRHHDFVANVLAVLERHGAEPRKLKLELTESLLVEDVEETIAKMTALKARGVSFSLDDFGTGYSSLSYLKRLPVDQLKIDRSFIRDVLDDPNDLVIARTIVALGQSMGMAVIAEGVETEGQLDFLTEQGCHSFQGYLFSRPLPLAEFERLLEQTPPLHRFPPS